MTIGAICYGVLITLGLSCLATLRRLPRARIFWSQRMVLMVHVCSLLVLNTALSVKGMKGNLVSIFETRPEALTYFYLDRFNIMAVIIFALTDGVLVWRCYMVQRVLLGGRPTRWQHICWIIPSALWLMSIGLGVTAVAISDPTLLLSEPPAPLSKLLLILFTFCNIALNTFATANIVIRLLIHRREMISSFGRTSTLSNFHVRIAGIVLESAAINVPISIASAVCSILVGGFGLLAWQIGVPTQSFSSVLVIYQVAKGRAVGSESMSSNKGSESQRLDTIITTQTDTYD
ncbi:hypothetical protein P691DRAFT_803059, partial [Macrolepiota fuliginosa MF-IS2]